MTTTVIRKGAGWYLVPEGVDLRNMLPAILGEAAEDFDYENGDAAEFLRELGWSVEFCAEIAA